MGLHVGNQEGLHVDLVDLHAGLQEVGLQVDLHVVDIHDMEQKIQIRQKMTTQMKNLIQ